MQILIRTGSSPEIGGGHITRTMALADTLHSLGAEITFALRGNCALKNHYHFKSICLPGKPGEMPGITRDEWDILVHYLDFYDAIITDAYEIGVKELTSLASTRKLVACIDDRLGNFCGAHLVINQNPYANALGLQISEGARLLYGPRYAMLRSEIAKARFISPPDPPPYRVAIMIGSSDLMGATAPLISAMAGAKTSLPVRIDAILGHMAPTLEAVQKAVSKADHAKLHINPPNLAQLLATSHVAIIAAGTSALELACLGVPAVMVVVAKNQESSAAAWHELGVHISVGFFEEGIEEYAAEKVISLLNDCELRSSMSAKGKAIVDGLGTVRVAREIVKAIEKRHGEAA